MPADFRIRQPGDASIRWKGCNNPVDGGFFRETGADYLTCSLRRESWDCQCVHCSH